MKLSVIIPTYRNSKYLDLCLKSATENRVLDETEILVVVDGFIDESKDVLSQYKGIGVLELPQNKGMQYALNIGVMQATSEYVFIINDDNVFPKRWDERLHQEWMGPALLSERDVITINQVEPTGPGMFAFPVMDLGQDVESFQYEKWLEYEESIKQPLVLTDQGHIFPFIMSKKYYMAVGGFDIFYDSPNICDWDFFLKLELLGFQFTRTLGLALYHFGSVATKKNKENASFIAREQKAMEAFNWKWGIMPYNKPHTNSKIPLDRKFRGFSV